MSEKEAQPRRPRLVVRIVTPLVILLAMLVLLEIFLQIFLPLPFFDRLSWLADGHVKARLEPHQAVENVAGNPVRINHLGFRGEDWSWQPAPGTLRLITLGGSSTFCFQVSDDAHTWPAQLERMLQEKLDVPVEVLNLALPGYDTSTSKVNYLFTGRALGAHAVLVYHTWNDMKFLRPIDHEDEGGTPRCVLSGRSNTGTNKSLLNRIFRRLQVVQRADRILTKIRQRDRENRYTSLEKEGERAHAPVTERAWRWFEQNFVDVVAFAQDDGVLPVLISQATLVHEDTLDDPDIRLVVSNDYLGMTLPRLHESWQRANEIIRRVAATGGAVFVDGYAAVPPDLQHLKDGVHLWDPGAERLARAVADTLLADPRFQARVREVAVGKAEAP